MVGGETVNSKRRLKRQMKDHNHSVCVSNVTNSDSPDDKRSRIFIGNLNTSVITKRHLHLFFIQFGDIKAISMHKGKSKVLSMFLFSPFACRHYLCQRVMD